MCPGSFDPPTLGHVDVIQRSADVFDKVVVAVIRNPSKSAMFSTEERIEMLEELFAGEPKVEVDSFEGLLVDFARQRQVDVIVKGLRAVTDFEYELQMAQMNFYLAEIETAFVAASPEYGYLSSSLVKEVARFGGAIQGLVPESVARRLKERFGT
jgi:pantetheine-phosphate adenylyltransferase